MARPKIIVLDNQTAYLPGCEGSRYHIAKPDRRPGIRLNFEDKSLRRVVPWGENNDLPQVIMKQCYSSAVASAGLQVNISMSNGDGIVYGRWPF